MDDQEHQRIQFLQQLEEIEQHLIEYNLVYPGKRKKLEAIFKIHKESVQQFNILF